MLTLAHLHIHYMINVECVEYFLYHGRCLETLRLDYILCWDVEDDEGDYPPMIHSSDQISPVLKSVTMEFYEEDPDDRVRACQFQHL